MERVKLSKADYNKLLSLIELRLRYLESLQWTTKDDERRVDEMHRLNILWSNLVASLDSLRGG
jgi:hypothetical protein